MSLETVRICDICGKPIEDSDKKWRQFRVKENILSMYFGRVQRIQREDGIAYVSEFPFRNWTEIDCHSDCVLSLLKAKRETKEEADGNRSN